MTVFFAIFLTGLGTRSQRCCIIRLRRDMTTKVRQFYLVLVIQGSPEDDKVILVKLREAMEAYRKRTGKRLSYEELAKQTGLSRATLESIGSRDDYNPSLDTIERLCRTLGVELDGFLELVDNEGKRGRGTDG